MTADIKAIVFDIGGIVEPAYGDAILVEVAQFTGVSRTLLDAHLGEHKVALSEGRMSLEEFYSRVTDSTARVRPPQVVARHLEVYRAATAVLDARVLALIETLKERYTVACLSNTELEVARMNRERGLFGLFHRAYLSTELGLHKPDRGIFEQVLRDLQCAAGEVIFTDDSEANVKGAAATGMHAICYRDFDHFSIELASLLRRE